MTLPNNDPAAANAAPGNETPKQVLDLSPEGLQAIASALAAAMKQGATEVVSDVADVASATMAAADAPKTPLLKRLAPRLLACLVVGVALLSAVALLAPQQLGVILYKSCLLTLAGYGGYWLDRWVFPYGRPDGYLAKTWQTVAGATQDGADYAVAAGYELVFSLACLRRCLIMFAAIVGMGLGL